MQRTQTRLRIGVSLVAMMAVLALVVVITMAGSTGQTSATHPPEPQPGSDGLRMLIFDTPPRQGYGIGDGAGQHLGDHAKRLFHGTAGA